MVWRFFIITSLFVGGDMLPACKILQAFQPMPSIDGWVQGVRSQQTTTPFMGKER